MRRYLTSLACSGLLAAGALSGTSAFAMSIPDIAPTVDAAGEAFRTLPAQPDGQTWNLSCTAAACNGKLESAVLVRKPSDDAMSGLQLIRGGGGHGGFGGGGGVFHGGGGGFRGMGGGWHGGGFRGMGGGWHGGGWRGGTVWRGGGWHGIGGNGWRGNYWRGGWHGVGSGYWPRNYWRNNYWNNNYWGGGGFFGFGIPIFSDYGYDDSYYNYPYVNYATPVVTDAHAAWCYSRYRSYRASDNTFQPYNGPRRQCISPY